METNLLTVLFLSTTFVLSCKSIEPTTRKNPSTISSPNKMADTTYACQLNGNLTVDERRNISLFKAAKIIQVVSFSQKVVSRTPIDANKLVSKYVRDEITLTEPQIDSLTEILYNYHFSKELSSKSIKHGECYEPRHAIVFLNSSNNIIGYFELCFACHNHQTVPRGENMGEFCSTKYRLIEDFFRSVGVVFFNEED